MKTSLAATLLFFAFAIAGCYTPRYVYSPSAQNIPLFTNEGDAKLSANFSSNLTGRAVADGEEKNNKANGMDLQAGYAYNKHWFVHGNYYKRRERNTGDFSIYKDSAVIRYKRTMMEAGVGYYNKLNSEGSLFFQLSGGVGFGNFSFTDRGKDQNRLDYTRYHSSKIFKLYLQPVWTFQHEKKVAASLSSRFSIINYGNIKTDYSNDELNDFQLFELSRGPVVFWEPAFVNTFGFSKLPGFYLEYQLGMSLLMSRRFVDARLLNFSAGIYIDPPLLFKKKKKASPTRSVDTE